MDIYRFFWKHIGGHRPWTYTIRQWGLEHPELIRVIAYSGCVILVAAQILMARWFGLWSLPVVLAADGLFILIGHLWWDTMGANIKHQVK